MTPAERKERESRAKALPALLQVGKRGVTDAFVEELSLLARKRGLVKVRLLRSFAATNDVKAAAQELSSRAGLDLISVTGSTVVLAAPKKQ